MSDPAPKVQGTEEWVARRWGKFTGTRFGIAMARDKRTGKKLKAWDDLIWEIAVERITEPVVDQMDSYALRWGREVEPYAREAYELATGHFVEQVEFVDHPLYSFAGCSPDGLIGLDGGLELKSPKNSVIHLQRFETGTPEEFKPQIQGGMWVTHRQWWDFGSYDPRMPEKLRLLRITVKRDDDYIQELEDAVLDAEAAVVQLVNKFKIRAAA